MQWEPCAAPMHFITSFKFLHKGDAFESQCILRGSENREKEEQTKRMDDTELQNQNKDRNEYIKEKAKKIKNYLNYITKNI